MIRVGEEAPAGGISEHVISPLGIANQGRFGIVRVPPHERTVQLRVREFADADQLTLELRKGDPESKG